MTVLIAIAVALLIAAVSLIVVARVRRGERAIETNKQAPRKQNRRPVLEMIEDDWEAQHDNAVAASQRIWPIVKTMPLFWALSFITVLSIALNFVGAYALTSGIENAALGVLFGCVIWAMFTVADIIVPSVSMSADKGTGEWYEFKENDRSIPALTAVYICGALQLFVIFISTSEIANVNNAANQIGATGFQSSTTRIDTINKSLAALPAEPQTYAQLKATADGAEKKAMIESYRSRRSSTVPADPKTWGPHCGPQCLRDKEAVRVLRERQAVAKSREDLLAERTTLQKGLNESGTARVRDAQWAYNLEATGISAEVSKTFGVMWIGWAIYIVSFIGWQMLADRVGRLRRDEYAKIGGRYDRERVETYNAPPKYVVNLTEQDLPQIEGPEFQDGPTDRVEVHHINADELRKRFKNDEFITEIYELFDTLLVPVEGEAVSIDEVHRRYKICTLKSDPNARYAMRGAFANALSKIIMVRDDIRIASGTIVGWAFADADTQQPAQEAAE